VVQWRCKPKFIPLYEHDPEWKPVSEKIMLKQKGANQRSGGKPCVCCSAAAWAPLLLGLRGGLPQVAPAAEYGGGATGSATTTGFLQSVSQTSLDRCARPACQPGARRKEPQPVKMRRTSPCSVTSSNLDEGVGVLRLGRRPREAGPRVTCSATELDRLTGSHVEADDRPVILSRPENSADCGQCAATRLG